MRSALAAVPASWTLAWAIEEKDESAKKKRAHAKARPSFMIKKPTEGRVVHAKLLQSEDGDLLQPSVLSL